MDIESYFIMLSMTSPDETLQVSSGFVFKVIWKGGDFIEYHHNYSGKK